VFWTSPLEAFNPDYQQQATEPGNGYIIFIDVEQPFLQIVLLLDISSFVRTSAYIRYNPTETPGFWDITLKA